MKESYYFSHDANARNDEKILMLRSEYGWEGYGIYWVLVEMMFESSETGLYHSKIKGIAAGHSIDITLLENVINTCITENLFVSDKVMFWSESLRRRKEKYLTIKQKKSEAGKKGMAKRWGTDNTDITELKDSNNDDITKDNKGKERKGNKVKESKKDTHVKVLDMYHEKLDELPKVLKLNDSRKKAINARLEEYSLEDIKTVFEKASESDFLTGRSKDWSANFDWIMKPTNFIKILEGNYDNRKGGQNGNSSGDNREGANETSKWGIDHLIQRAEN